MEIFQDIKKYEDQNDLVDNDFDRAFTKIASEDVKSFADLEEKVKTFFNNDQAIMLKFAKWLDKLSLDKNRLIEISKNFSK